MAGGSSAKLVVEIITDASKAGKGIDEASTGFGKFNSVMGNLVGPATAVLGGITALGVAAINSASDMQQAAGGVDAVFGSSAGTINAWAKDAANAVGLSEAAYSTFAAQVGAQLKNLGVPMDQVAGQTNDLITLGADLAATYGGTTEEAVSALSAAFRGEADPAERYGLALNATAVNAELAARGLTGLEGEALTAAKAQIIMEKATQQAGGAVGQFGRESDTLAGQQQRLNAQISNMSAELGSALLPVITPVVAALADFAKWIGENTTLVQVIIGVIGALAAAVIAYTVAQWAANVAMMANPIGLIVAGIVLLIAAIVALGIWIGNNTEQIRAFFEGLWKGIQEIAGAVADWFVSVWSAVSAWFIGNWNNIASFFSTIWSGIQTAVQAVVQFFQDAWNNAVQFVTAAIRGWSMLFQSIFNAIQSVIGSIASFFSNAWKSAVDTVSSVIRTLQSVFTSVFNAIMVPINAVIGAFNAIVNAVKNVIDWIGRIKIPDVFGAIGNLFSPNAATVAAAAPLSATPMLAGSALGFRSATASLASGTGAGGVSINIYGGLDSADAIGRRVESVLTGRARRNGGVTIARRTR